jgi:hypothetical protein
MSDTHEHKTVLRSKSVRIHEKAWSVQPSAALANSAMPIPVTFSSRATRIVDLGPRSSHLVMLSDLEHLVTRAGRYHEIPSNQGLSRGDFLEISSHCSTVEHGREGDDTRRTSICSTVEHSKPATTLASKPSRPRPAARDAASRIDCVHPDHTLAQINLTPQPR